MQNLFVGKTGYVYKIDFVEAVPKRQIKWFLKVSVTGSPT
jgi:hypothetical protein